MNPSVVRLILAESRKQGLKEKSLALRLSALRQFFSYLVQQGQLKVNPATGISAPKQGKHLPKILMLNRSKNCFQMTAKILLICVIVR